MPRKIQFNVVSSSSHEDNFGANKLLNHAPTVDGWRSGRLCSYPQHITLQMVERSRVRKLQLLAHQFMIPSKVEFHIGDSLTETSPTEFPPHLLRLGYVSLCDNEKTCFKARELKSVHMDAIGTFLRITLHKNHINRYNHFNQVALVAINFLGDPLEANIFNTFPSREQLIEHYLSSTQQEAALVTTFMGKCESISPLDDLAFDMYQDPEIAHIIRLLYQRKQDMVQQENFEQAKNLKQAIADLQKVGERLARYDVEKRCAIEKEDYDLAKKKKDLMDEYRKNVYQQLEVHNLLDMTMINEAAATSQVQSPSKPIPSSPHQPDSSRHPLPSNSLKKTKKSSYRQNQQSDTKTLASIHLLKTVPDSNLRPADASKNDVTAVANDERPLPALQRKDVPMEVPWSSVVKSSTECDAQGTQPNPEMSGEPEPLTEKIQREASLPLEIYGERLVAGVYSKSWCHREDALQAVHKKLLEVSSTTPKEELRNTIRAAVFLVRKTLLDKVTSVFHASLKLLRLILGQFIPGQNLGRAEVIHCLEQTFPNLLVRTGDSASRPRTAAINAIQDIAVLKDVRTLLIIPGELLKPFKSNFPSRLAQSRAELLEKLLTELGTESSGFTLEKVITFCTAALEHSAKPVREPALRTILFMYQHHRSAILSYLPPNNTSTRKNFLYKTLFDGFAKMDGNLETQAGEKEREEIHSLQKQLAVLKEITEKGSSKEEKLKKEHRGAVKEPQKAVKRNVKKSPRSQAAESLEQSVEYLDNLCIFCGKKDESFTEDGLDLHYWKQCPMLRRCDECKQVVEISSLTEHLLGECENRSQFSQCGRCTEAVVTQDLTSHVQGPTCNSLISGTETNHCPLCHTNIPPGDESWKAHLMGREGCKQNSRRTTMSQRTQLAQGKVIGGPKLRQAWSVGARARPVDRGNRNPSLTPSSSKFTPGKH